MRRESAIRLFMVCFLGMLMAIDIPNVRATTPTITFGVCENNQDLVGCWQMDEGQGITTADAGADSKHLANLYGPKWITPGYNGIGRALQFDGSSNYLSVDNHSDLQITDAITLSAWIKPGVGSPNATRAIISKGEVGISTGPSYELNLSPSSDTSFPQKAYVRINYGAKSDEYRVNSTTPYPTNGLWVHVAGTFDGKTAQIYINGKKENEKGFETMMSIMVNSKPLTIGSQSEHTSKFFLGLMDDVRVYKRSLYPYEISWLANQPTAATLSSFTGAVEGNIVTLKWSTVDEKELIGFNVYRENISNSSPEQVNRSIILANSIDHPVGAEYQFTDVVDLGQRYTYSLEMVKTDGNWPGPQINVETGFWLNLPFLIR